MTPTTPSTSALDIARTWLQSGKAPSARAPEVARAIGLLTGQLPCTAATLQGLGSDVEGALLAEAEAQAAVAVARLVADHAADKQVAKQAKKVLFKWKQQGVTVPERGQDRNPVSLGVRPEPLPSYASSIDGGGGQLIFLGGWSAADGPWCLMGMLTDRDGLLSGYRMVHVSRTQQREMLDRLRRQIEGFVVEVPADFAAGRLRWALDVRQQSSALFEGDVAQVRAALEGVEPVPEVELALDATQEAALPALLANSAALAREPCFKGWLRLPPAQQSAFDAARAAARGDAAATQETRDRLYSEWLDASELQRLAARLDINAWLLHCTGRGEAALQAIAVAHALRQAHADWRAVPLLVALAESATATQAAAVAGEAP